LTAAVWAVTVSIELRFVEPHPINGVCSERAHFLPFETTIPSPTETVTASGGAETVPVAPFAQKKSSETRTRSPLENNRPPADNQRVQQVSGRNIRITLFFLALSFGVPSLL